MKKSRQVCASTVLTLLLAVPSLAGEIHTGIAPPPPLPALASAEVVTAPDGGFDAQQTTVATADSPTEVALNFILSVLALF